jgi:hypothetical protein
MYIICTRRLRRDLIILETRNARERKVVREIIKNIVRIMRGKNILKGR